MDCIVFIEFMFMIVVSKPTRSSAKSVLRCSGYDWSFHTRKLCRRAAEFRIGIREHTVGIVPPNPCVQRPNAAKIKKPADSRIVLCLLICFSSLLFVPFMGRPSVNRGSLANHSAICTQQLLSYRQPYWRKGCRYPCDRSRIRHPPKRCPLRPYGLEKRV